MAARKVLDARVAGTQSVLPGHPRVEPLTVQSVLQRRPSTPFSVNVSATSLEALTVMAEYDVGAVLVLDGRRVIGVFSERDYSRASTRTAQSPAAVPVRELMHLCDTFASPADSVNDCLNRMTHDGLQHLPVQHNGDIVAMLSLDDLLYEMVAYLERVFKEYAVDQQIVFLSGTYSC